jgi:hypothetical protein
MIGMMITVGIAEMIKMTAVIDIVIASLILDWPACWQNQMCLLQST